MALILIVELQCANVKLSVISPICFLLSSTITLCFLFVVCSFLSVKCFVM